MAVQGVTLSQWIAIVQAEYREMPGLHLTKRQAQRLWGLDTATCDSLLGALEGSNFLRKTTQAAYVRADSHV